MTKMTDEDAIHWLENLQLEATTLNLSITTCQALDHAIQVLSNRVDVRPLERWTNFENDRISRAAQLVMDKESTIRDQIAVLRSHVLSHRTRLSIHIRLTNALRKLKQHQPQETVHVHGSK